MSFAHPWAFALGLLAIPLVLLYRRATLMPQRVVATDWLWERALAEERLRTRWQKYRWAASLALHLIALALLAVAAAGPLIPPPRHIAIAIDNGASMNALLGAGTRLDAAKASARTIAASLRDSDEAVIFAAAGQPSQRCGVTGNHDALLRAIDAITPVEGVAAWDRTLSTIKLAYGEDASGKASKTQVIAITDGCSDFQHLENAARLQVDLVGNSIGHVAITRFAARRSLAEPKTCDLFVELQSFSNQQTRGKLSIMLDGKEQTASNVSLAAFGKEKTCFAVNAPAGGNVVAQFVPTEGTATGLADDRQAIDLPPARLHAVRLVCDDRSSLKPVFAADRRVSLVNIASDADDSKPATSPTSPPTITVFDGGLPAKLPAGPLLVFHPTDCDAWRLGKLIADPEAGRIDDASTVLHGVQLYDAFLADARELIFVDSLEAKAKPIIWTEKGEPLAYTIDRAEGRIVVIGGDLTAGNLALQAGFSRVVSQALDWLDGAEPVKDEVLYAPHTSQTAIGEGVNLVIPSTIKSNLGSEFTTKARVPLWLYPAGVALALMICEWCLYQRRWVC